MSFPIDRRNDRHFEAGWSGDVVTCDIDRTYLETRFSSLKGIARIPFEFAIDKQDILGMAALLREVRRGPAEQSRHTPLFFVSASPAQLRPVIQRKMLLDGLEYDGTTFKDWSRVVKRLRFKRFKEQVGYKLTALLTARCDLPTGATEVLIGDDLETDALTFSIYADVLAGRVAGDALRQLLKKHNVAKDDAAALVQLAERAVPSPMADGVRRIYLRLERGQPEDQIDFFPKLIGCESALVMGFAMWCDGLISEQGLSRICCAIPNKEQLAADLAAALGACVERGIATAERLAPAIAQLVEDGHLSAAPDLPLEAGGSWQAARQNANDWWTPQSRR